MVVWGQKTKSKVHAVRVNEPTIRHVKKAKVFVRVNMPIMRHVKQMKLFVRMNKQQFDK